MGVSIRFGAGPAENSAHPLDTRIRAAIRRCLGDEVERLIAIMDSLDVDADLEPAGDEEPSLGWIEFAGRGVTSFEEMAATDDREEDAGDEGEPDTDREPALGWTAEGRHGHGWFWGEDEA